MNLESFAIGILTMVIFALVIITVIGILKALKFAKRLLQIEQRMDDDRRTTYSEFTEVYRRSDQLEQNLFQGINETEKAANSYTDRRIDKLIDSMDLSVFASKKEKTKREILKD